MAGMASEQAALQQGLQQLGRNLAQADRDNMMGRDIDAAVGRANLNMQEAIEQLQAGRTATQQAEQSVEALNRLALALLQNAQQLDQQGGGSGAQQELSDLAQQQGSLTGQSSSLLPLDVSEQARSEEARRMAAEQHNISRQLAGMNDLPGGRESLQGRIDEMAREAESIARDLAARGLRPDIVARQERLFHRLLDAGRTLEKEDETTEERTGERGRAPGLRSVPALDPALLDPARRYRVPTPQELEGLPPAYRRLILDYFERINRAEPAGSAPAGARPTGGGG
jgi:hypothetical protein